MYVVRIPFGIYRNAVIRIYTTNGVIERKRKYAKFIKVKERPLFLLEIRRTKHNHYWLFLYAIKKSVDNGIYACIPIAEFHSYYTPFVKALEVLSKLKEKYIIPEKLENDILTFISL